jgi:hypothetical protein
MKMETKIKINHLQSNVSSGYHQEVRLPRPKIPNFYIIAQIQKYVTRCQVPVYDSLTMKMC